MLLRTTHLPTRPRAINLASPGLRVSSRPRLARSRVSAGPEPLVLERLHAPAQERQPQTPTQTWSRPQVRQQHPRRPGLDGRPPLTRHGSPPCEPQAPGPARDEARVPVYCSLSEEVSSASSSVSRTPRTRPPGWEPCCPRQAPAPARQGRCNGGRGLMLPLGGRPRLQGLKTGLKALKCIGADVAINIWWGEVESEAPQQYDWSATDRLLHSAREVGLRVRVGGPPGGGGAGAGRGRVSAGRAWVTVLPAASACRPNCRGM